MCQLVSWLFTGKIVLSNQKDMNMLAGISLKTTNNVMIKDQSLCSSWFQRDRVRVQYSSEPGSDLEREAGARRPRDLMV